MAFGTKGIITSLGIEATFWTIPKIEMDRFAQQAYIVVYGYLDKEHSDIVTGKFLDRIFVNVYPTQFDEYFSLDILKKGGVCELDMAYKFVRENVEQFKNAIDLIYDENGKLIDESPYIPKSPTEPADVDDYDDYSLNDSLYYDEIISDSDSGRQLIP